MFAFGGAKAWKVMQYGDIAVSFQWDDEDGMRILCLWNAHRIGSGVWVLHDSVLGQLLSTAGSIERDASPVFRMGLRTLDREESPNELHRLIDVVVAAYEELHDMPPRPRELMERARPAPMFEVTHKQGDQIIGQAEV